jgi:hypothetical protein
MPRPLLILLLLLASFSLQAELYKGVDEEGNVYFTDKEIPNAEKIPMRMPTSIQMPKPEQKVETTEQPAAETSYTEFQIIQPANDATIRDNSGNVSVSLALTPDLNLAAGHTISVSIDGKPASKGGKSLKVRLLNIDRGSHTIKASILNKLGKTIKTSNSVTIHLKRKGLSAAPRTYVDPENPEIIVFNGPGPQTTTYRPGPIIVRPTSE